MGAAGRNGKLQAASVGELEATTKTRHGVHEDPARLGQQHIGAIVTTYRGQLALALLLALGARLFILITSHGMMDGDEAVLGIQAERILQGAHPIYFYGQPYMGSWDAYLAAPLIALFGPSAWPLHTVTLAESLPLVPLLGALAARLYGVRARLPAMLLAAIPPEYVAVGELRMLGGYVETLVLGTALLLMATHVAARWQAGRSTAAQWVIIGLLMGLALWIDVLIAYYLVAAGLWLAPYAIMRARRGLTDGWRWWRGVLVAGAGCIVAMACTAVPAIIYAPSHHFANVTAITTHPAWLDQVSPIRGSVLVYIFTHALPSVTGIRLTWGVPRLLALALGCLAAAAVLAALIYVAGRILTMGDTKRRLTGMVAGVWSHWNDTLPLLLLAVVVLIFWRSSETALVYGHPNQDAGGRYALPATTALSLLLAALFAALPGLSTRLSRRDGTHRSTVRLAQALFVLLLVVYALPYVTSDNVSAMQSPETQNMVFPAEHTELLAYFDEHHITYLWSNHWICHLVMYLENQRVVCGDYVDVSLKQAPNRFPEAIQATMAADRPSFVFNADPTRGEPAVARALDALGVTYTSAHFGSIWIVTPLSRTVFPEEIAQALLQDY